MSEEQSYDGQWTTPPDSPLISQGSIQQGGMFNCWPPPVPSQNVTVNPTGTVLQPIPLRISAASSTGLADMNYRPSTPYLRGVEAFRGASAICEREQYVSAFSNVGDQTSGFYAERAVLNWNPLELNAGRTDLIRRYDIPDYAYSGRPTRRARVPTLPHFSDFAPRRRYLLENPYTVRYSPYELPGHQVWREDAARLCPSVDPSK
ncbi:hypothetical protein CEXT_788611 [Caerostris extrusa]|uniref:Uncharacterized protein n=1 Tax=Caerostris extrusa TaxID=172846 RepID=A0AAV4NRG3_CAEEX|nr:hypothetical protein CEXT_788611 [Caerostris extrusa]